MQLSFSIDVILGTTTNKSERGQEISNKDESTLRNAKVNDTHLEGECASPRSHTIEWKPTGCDITHSPSHRKSVQKNEKCEKERFQLSKSALRSPPNARVIPHCDIIKLQSGNAIDNPRDEDSFISKMESLKSFQKRLSATNFLPYSAESLQNHGIHHHPHHYPYQMPYVGHSHNEQPGPIPGIFSPHYSFQKCTDNSKTTEGKNSEEESEELEGKFNAKASATTSKKGQHFTKKESDPQSQSSGGDLHPAEESYVENYAGANEAHKPIHDGNYDVSDENINPGKKKRVGRRLFTGFQILELEKAFAVKPYLNRMERAFISQKVNLTECQIKTWFQNRRTKEKRRGNGSEEEDLRTNGVFRNAVESYPIKAMRIPGYGIQLAPTYGPPDQHLQAAIVDYLKRRVCPDNLTSGS